MALLVTADAVRSSGGLLGDAVLVEGSRIAAVGDAAALRRSGVPEEHFPGGTIIPGLRDAHLHPVGYAAALARPSLKQAADFSELGELLQDAAASAPAGAAIVGLRLDDESLAEGRLPDRRLLDAILPDRPVLLVRYCGHVAVANTLALERAGVTAATPDPEGGIIDRDPGGAPTGVLRETAVEPLTEALAPLEAPLAPETLADAVAGLASFGMTGMGGIVAVRQGLWGGGSSELRVLLEAAQHIPIPIGVLVIARSPSELEAAALRIDDAGGGLRFLGLKAFADGSLGGHTAALRAPYADRPDRSGTLRLDRGVAEVAATALRLGGRVAVHAIGDAAVCRVLDLYTRMIDRGADPAMLRVEHASVVSDRDAARFAELGVTAVVQPAFLASEHTWLAKRLGPDRLRNTYAFRTLLDAGVPVAGSSDCPVEPPSPLHGMAAARHRGGVAPDQALDGAEALGLFSDSAALAIGETAALAAGAPATFTVLDRDPVEADPRTLSDAAARATWVAGRRVRWNPARVTWRG
jgi:predicted amidohydrolase YtcJ